MTDQEITALVAASVAAAIAQVSAEKDAEIAQAKAEKAIAEKRAKDAEEAVKEEFTPMMYINERGMLVGQFVKKFKSGSNWFGSWFVFKRAFPAMAEMFKFGCENEGKMVDGVHRVLEGDTYVDKAVRVKLELNPGGEEYKAKSTAKKVKSSVKALAGIKASSRTSQLLNNLLDEE